MNAGFNDRFEGLRRFEHSSSNVVIRRYLNATKFLDFLRTWELYFAPASKFSDKEEGFFTLADQTAREHHLRQLHVPERTMNSARRAWDTIAISNAKAVVISCWTMGEAENPRIWKEYGKSNDAVAIETSLDALRRSLGREFLAVPVRYVDRDQTLLPDGHSLIPFFYKGLDYSWEVELRFIAEMVVGERLGTPRRISVPPDKVAFRFVLAPGASGIRKDEVKRLLSSYCPPIVVVRSSLTDDAVSW